MTPLAENKPGPANLLTDREREVMAYVAAHYRSKQIRPAHRQGPKDDRRPGRKRLQEAGRRIP